MNRTSLKSTPFLTSPLSGQDAPDGVVPFPSPRPATCSEIGCDAPASTWVCVPVSGPRGDDMDPVRMPYCASCSQKPGLVIADMAKGKV